MLTVEFCTCRKVKDSDDAGCSVPGRHHELRAVLIADTTAALTWKPAHSVPFRLSGFLDENPTRGCVEMKERPRTRARDVIRYVKLAQAHYRRRDSRLAVHT
jgi:hypothetical protein